MSRGTVTVWWCALCRDIIRVGGAQPPAGHQGCTSDGEDLRAMQVPWVGNETQGEKLCCAPPKLPPLCFCHAHWHNHRLGPDCQPGARTVRD